MIVHRPLGCGHPYLLDRDQRIPVYPLAGDPLELRATTSPAATGVRAELERDGLISRLEGTQESAHSDEIGPYAAPRNGAARHFEGSARVGVAGVSARTSWRVVVDGADVDRPFRYRFVTDDGEATPWYDVVPAVWERGPLAVEHFGEISDDLRSRLIPESVEWLRVGAVSLRARFKLSLRHGEHVVGFGERFNALDQRGRALDTVVFEQYKGQGARTYLPTPFAYVLGESTCGFHVATSHRCWFDVGVADADIIGVEVDLDGDGRLTLELYGGDPRKILAEFLTRHGPPKLPPEWVFEPWMSSNEWNMQKRVLEQVRRSEREGIPAGVIVIEAWSDEETFVAFADAQSDVHPDGSPHRLGDFTFPPDGAWPDPKAMVDELHRRGVRVLLWQIPLVKADPPPASQAAADWEAMIARGYQVRQEDGSAYRNRGWWFPRSLLVDFTNEEARAWWLAKRRYLVDELGIDGFKTDGGEHAWGRDLRYADGTRGSETNNRYPVLYAAAYHELFAHAGREGTTFSRAGFTGSAAYPCHWAGDEDSTWEAFRASLTAGITAGASGIFFWGWDLAGFSGELPPPELYLRAAAAACFCPIMQYHSEFNEHGRPSRDRTPWNIAEQTGDARVIPIYRRFATLRTRLIPYLAEQARLSVARAAPLMRALFFEWRDDERIWDFPLQYLLGDELLVAPVTAPGITTMRLYVPFGEWVDAWRDEVVIGPTPIERDVPLSEIPVYVRARAREQLVTLFSGIEEPPMITDVLSRDELCPSNHRDLPEPPP